MNIKIKRSLTLSFLHLTSRVIVNTLLTEDINSSFAVRTLLIGDRFARIREAYNLNNRAKLLELKLRNISYNVSIRRMHRRRFLC